MDYLKLIMVLLLFPSCSKEISVTETIEKKIEDSIKQELDNPKKFEFVSFNKLDTIQPRVEQLLKLRESFKNTNDIVMQGISQSKSHIIELQKRLKSAPSQKKLIKAQIIKWTKQIEKDSIEFSLGNIRIAEFDTIIDSLEKNSDLNYEITGNYKFRTTNNYNATVLKSYKVSFNDSLKILDLQELK